MKPETEKLVEQIAGSALQGNVRMSSICASKLFEAYSAWVSAGKPMARKQAEREPCEARSA